VSALHEPDTPAIRAARAAGVVFRLHCYPPETPDSLTAARLIGVEPERILKTLIAEIDRERLVIAALPVTARLNHGALAAAVDGTRSKLAPAALAEQVTGYRLRSISPLGLPMLLPIVCEAGICDYGSVFVSVGLPGYELELTPADLVRATGALTARIASG